MFLLEIKCIDILSESVRIFNQFGGGIMKLIKKKVNLLLVSFTFCLLVIIFSFEESTLNSLLVYYDDSFVINEISTSIDNEVDIDYNENAMPVNQNGEVVQPVVLNNIAFNDYWVWPTDGNYVITSGFGYRWGSMHDAIDISGPGYGSNIYAANNGVVTLVRGGCFPGNTSCNGRGGNYIVINHNSANYYTLYMHLKDIYVSEGQIVSRGQVIGTMGNTGNVVPVPTASAPYLGTHLHFGLYIGEPYRGGYAVNPMRLY